MKKSQLLFFALLLLANCGFCQNQKIMNQNQISFDDTIPNQIEGLWHITGCVSDIFPHVYCTQPILYFADNGIGGRILPSPYCDTIPFKYSVLDSNIVIVFDDSSRQNILSGYTYFSFEIVENKKGVFLKLFSIDRHYIFFLGKQD